MGKSKAEASTAISSKHKRVYPSDRRAALIKMARAKDNVVIFVSELLQKTKKEKKVTEIRREIKRLCEQAGLVDVEIKYHTGSTMIKSAQRMDTWNLLHDIDGLIREFLLEIRTELMEIAEAKEIPKTEKIVQEKRVSKKWLDDDLIEEETVYKSKRAKMKRKQKEKTSNV